MAEHPFRIDFLKVNEQTLLLPFITKSCRIDEESAEFLLKLGSVYKNEKRVTENVELSAEDWLRVHLHPRRFPRALCDWLDRIVDAQEDYVIVNKPSGVPSHPTLDNITENVLTQLSQTHLGPVYVTHRLDHDTEGLMLLARTKSFQKYFNELLGAGRGVEKRYFAWTLSPLSTGLCRDYMMPSPKAPKVIQSEPLDGWKECLLEILAVTPDEVGWRHEIRLLTGRPHQIRVQLAHRNAPILGDPVYGGAPAPKMRLQSFWLEFPLPGGEVRQYVLSK